MLDGELPEPESTELERHIAQCAECGSAEEDFQLLRREIRGLMVDRITVAPEASVFKRRIMVPVPAFAAAVLLLVVLAGMLIFLRTSVEEAGPVAPRRETARPAGDSLARFDGGGKAVIYKEERR